MIGNSSCIADKHTHNPYAMWKINPAYIQEIELPKSVHTRHQSSKQSPINSILIFFKKYINYANKHQQQSTPKKHQQNKVQTIHRKITISKTPI